MQGAIIESIERGKVILDVFGARETLMMKKREGGGPGLPSLPARISPPEPRPAPDLMEDEVDDIEVDEDLEEKQVRTTRRPPSIRPHRRINFRRNPIRSVAGRDDVGEEDAPEGREYPFRRRFTPFGLIISDRNTLRAPGKVMTAYCI